MRNPFRKKKTEPVAKKSTLREWFDALLFAFVASTIARVLVFSAYAIPSGSMESSLLVGDYLFVSKAAYGPRMPTTPLTIPFLEPEINGTRTYSTLIELPYFRLPGWGQPAKGDIVVFNKPKEADAAYNKPLDMRTSLIKRCQATPGDKVQIINSHVYINGKPALEAPGQQTSYFVKVNGNLNPQTIADIAIEVRSQTAENIYEMVIPTKRLEEFKRNTAVASVIPVVMPAGQANAEMFPHNEKFKWNEDNYGPLVMPKSGMSIPLNDSTLTLYRRAIEIYEHNQVTANGSGIMLNGKPASTYTFKMNYYWMMGDNRHNSIDSRFWGYVPEDHIVGKAMYTWLSFDSTKTFPFNIRWDKIARRIR